MPAGGLHRTQLSLRKLQRARRVGLIVIEPAAGNVEAALDPRNVFTGRVEQAVDGHFVLRAELPRKLCGRPGARLLAPAFVIQTHRRRERIAVRALQLIATDPTAAVARIIVVSRQRGNHADNLGTKREAVAKGGGEFAIKFCVGTRGGHHRRKQPREPPDLRIRRRAAHRNRFVSQLCGDLPRAAVAPQPILAGGITEHGFSRRLRIEARPD